MMREMKDTGIEWIGQIPVNWKIVPFMIYLDNKVNAIVDGPFGSDMKNEEYVDDGVPVIQLGAIKECWMDFSKIHFITNEKADTLKRHNAYPKDIAIAKMMPAGKACEIPDTYTRYVVSADVIKASISNEYLRKYIVYALNSCATVQAEIESQGSTRSRVNIEKVKRFKLPCPIQDDIKQIVIYLDKKCAEIDTLLNNIRFQIEALEEYKRSVITEAVTKGLDPDVEMKDSGIAWIGDVPKHWLTEKVKFHLSRNEPRNPGDKQVLSVYREYGVIPKDSRDDNHNVTSEDTSNYKYVVPGNLVINKMKAWQGSMGISEYEGIVSPAYFIYRFTDNLLLPKYLHYLFRSCYKDEFRRISGGIREGQWDLSPYEFSNTLLLIPPIDEQQQIVDYIDSKIDDIESIIIKKKQQIETIEEYKKSLIFEYVTGKKEVIL